MLRMRSSTTKVGLIGAGNIGLTHLISLSTLKEVGLLDVDLVAICDTNKESLDRAAETFSIAAPYDDYRDLLSNKEVDVVYICTPTNTHQTMVSDAAKRKKYIFCEKPLAHKANEAAEMLEVVRRARVPSAVGLVLRYDDFLLYSQKLVRESDFGTPMLAYIRDDQHIPVDFMYYSSWRGDKSVAGGGTLIEHSIHDLDILRWFFGDIVRVYARTRFVSGKQVEDLASLVITHKSGTVSSLNSIWHSVERPNERLIEFFFQKGYIGIHLGSGERYLEYHLSGQEPRHVSKTEAREVLLDELGIDRGEVSKDAIEAVTSLGNERYSALSYSIIRAMQNGKEPHPGFDDAYEAHRAVDAAYISAGSNLATEL